MNWFLETGSHCASLSGLESAFQISLALSLGYFHVLFCVCISLCVYAVDSVGARRGQKRALDVLELDWQIAVNHLTWVLGTRTWQVLLIAELALQCSN